MAYSITDYERPSVAVDAAVFGVDDHKSSTMDEKVLKILLIKRGEEPFKDMYALPGGFLRKNETAEEAVSRELAEEAGVVGSKLIPLKVCSGEGRDPRGWIISAAFISLTNTVQLSTDRNSDALEAVWMEFRYDFTGSSEKLTISKDETVLEIIAENGRVIKNDFPFDHGTIIYEAFKKLQDEVRYHDIIFDLMPELFTVSDLHGPYQMILQKNESMQAFRKRMAPKIEETDKYDDTTAAHRKSKLYRRKIREE
ncbi:MAG: NUDIX domain-containing protein [Oscillospiraceae bacterium]